jgi:hypothetical protein
MRHQRSDWPQRIKVLVGNRTKPHALQKSRGVFVMPGAAYFHRQADICLRLALIASDEEVSNRLILMAREYTAKGAAQARQSGGDAPPRAHPPASRETEDPALPSPTDGADGAADC